ncbi:MAG TPA: FliH/SctL family protein [Myxococcaceae bacterium]|nr:FliH/SctL family protein [Myxococcaceae bacterium]
MRASQPRRPRFLDVLPAQRGVQPVTFPRPGAEPGPALRRLVAATPDAQLQPPTHDGPPPSPAPAQTPVGLPPEALGRLAAAIDLLKSQAERLAERARSDALEIGFQVARRILETELRSSPDALFALVRSALRKAGESRRVTVRLRPEDVAQLETTAGKQTLAEFSAAQIELKADSALGPGDVVVDTDFGRIDGRLASRLDELRRAVDGSAMEDAG